MLLLVEEEFPRAEDLRVDEVSQVSQRALNHYHLKQNGETSGDRSRSDRRFLCLSSAPPESRSDPDVIVILIIDECG